MPSPCQDGRRDRGQVVRLGASPVSRTGRRDRVAAMSRDERHATVAGVGTGPGYSHAVVVEAGRLAFIAGQVALDESGSVVGDDVATQARAALANLGRVLDAIGATWADVVKLGWFVLDIGQITAVRDARNEVLRPALGDRPNPASTAVQVSALVRPDLLVEVEAVVAVPSAGA